MTREELIEVICASDNSSFCHNICRTEEGFSCEVCAENQLEEYEKQIRLETLREVEQAMYHQAFEISHEKDGLQKWDSGNWIRYKLFEKIMKQLKGE